MFSSVRITIQLDNQLHDEARKWAAEQGTTLTALIEDSLRKALARRKPAQRRTSFRMITFSGDGLQPGVDLDNSASLIDRMEGIDHAN